MNIFNNGLTLSSVWCVMFLLFYYVERSCFSSVSNPCLNKPDGYHTNTANNCQIYFFCSNKQIIQNFTCDLGHSYHMMKEKCVPNNEGICIDLKCPSYDFNKYYTIPHTKCRMYYICMNGHRHDYLCPDNKSFSFELQTCVKKGLCYDPVCTGRINGKYPDTTQKCARSFECIGGKLIATEHCQPNEIYSEKCKRCIKENTPNEKCSLPQETAVAFPILQRKNMCVRLEDGVYTVPNSECKEYFVCKSRITLGILTCSEGHIFNGRECVSKQYYECKDFGCRYLKDGLHTDLFTECQDFFYCLDKRIAWKDSCPENMIFNGHKCVDEISYKCPSIKHEETNFCLNKKDGYYRNNVVCNEYYYCSDNEIRMRGKCPGEQIWSGSTCVDRGWFYCEGPKEWIGCLVKEGYYVDNSPKSQCTDYYYCYNGKVTRYACPPTESFDGEKCVPKYMYKCSISGDGSCDNLMNGYHADLTTNCESYFYCSEGIKNVFLCPKDKIFNGHECVYKTEYKCPSISRSHKVKNLCFNKENGYFVQPNTNCRKYVQCHDEKVLTEFVCPHNKVFNGVDDCVFKNCTNKLENYCEKDGFFVDFESKCKSYYYCIGRERKDLRCTNGTIFNGEVCVNEDNYKCPEYCERFKHCVNQ